MALSKDEIEQILRRGETVLWHCGQDSRIIKSESDMPEIQKFNSCLQNDNISDKLPQNQELNLFITFNNNYYLLSLILAGIFIQMLHLLLFFGWIVYRLVSS